MYCSSFYNGLLVYLNREVEFVGVPKSSGFGGSPVPITAETQHQSDGIPQNQERRP